MGNICCSATNKPNNDIVQKNNERKPDVQIKTAPSHLTRQLSSPLRDRDSPFVTRLTCPGNIQHNKPISIENIGNKYEAYIFNKDEEGVIEMYQEELEQQESKFANKKEQNLLPDINEENSVNLSNTNSTNANDAEVLDAFTLEAFLETSKSRNLENGN